MDDDPPNDHKNQYNVALSFPGQDHNYVKEVATVLKNNNIRVFFDEHEQIKLWGNELYNLIYEIYTSESRYVIIFISRHYAEKIWTIHEYKSAQERALKERKEYILPVRFD